MQLGTELLACISIGLEECLDLVFHQFAILFVERCVLQLMLGTVVEHVAVRLRPVLDRRLEILVVEKPFLHFAGDF